MGQEKKKVVIESKTLRVETIYGDLEISQRGDKYVWRISEKDLDVKEIPEWFGVGNNTFEEATP